MTVVYTGHTASRHYNFMLTIPIRQHSPRSLAKQTRIAPEDDLAGVVAWPLVDCATGGLSVRYTNLDLATANKSTGLSLSN
jgi:hypothetical protein